MTTIKENTNAVQSDIAEVQFSLNRLLANYQIHYQKLRNFHWNIVGPNFFELHEQFEVEYNEVRQQIDTIAERVRILGAKPYSTLKEYLDIAKIKEIPGKLSDYGMVEEIISDYTMLLPMLVNVLEVSRKVEDSSTEDMVTGIIQRMEKRKWMFTAWMEKA